VPRRPRRINVTAVGTPPRLPLRPFAMEILRTLDEKQAAARQAEREGPEGPDLLEKGRPRRKPGSR